MRPMERLGRPVFLLVSLAGAVSVCVLTYALELYVARFNYPISLRLRGPALEAVSYAMWYGCWALATTISAAGALLIRRRRDALGRAMLLGTAGGSMFALAVLALAPYD